MNRRALVRRPSPRLAEGLITHIARTPVDPGLAQQQWEGYVAALRDERRAETAGTEETLTSLGYRVARIEEPGTLDGGDVLKHGRVVWVGLGGRTNQSGVEQLGALLAPLGARVVGVPVSRVLHLKSAVTALPDGTVVGFEPLVDDPAGWEAFLPVPEEAGSHVVVLDGGTVLMSTSAPRTRALFEARGLRVVAVDISEFEKLEGCVTCLSVRLRG
jgi:dimethylargininase